MFTFFKRYRLLIAFLVAHLFVMALVLVEIDKQYFQNAKGRIIRDNHDYFFSLNLDNGEMNQLFSLALRRIRARGGGVAEVSGAHTQLVHMMKQICESDSIFYAITLYEVTRKDEQKEEATASAKSGADSRMILAEFSDPQKRKRMNDFSNCLILRDYTGSASLAVEDPATGQEVGRVLFSYTTPRGDPEITELLIQWRWRCLLILIVMPLIGYILARTLIVPTQNVLNQLEASTQDKRRFIRYERSRLESLYNRMALDAVEARLQGIVRENIAQNPGLTGWEVVDFVSREFARQLDAEAVGCLELFAEGPGRLRPSGQQVFHGPLWEKMKAPEQAEWLYGAINLDGRERGEGALSNGQGLFVWRLASGGERNGTRYLCALCLTCRGNRTDPETQHDALERLTDLIETSLQTLSLRNQLLVKERGRANISLSRNLGHDLTNIIATSKLEMMALERVLKGGNVPDDDMRREILIESVEGMLRSTRFMQETVNLYRAYAFLQHPVLEAHDGNQLIEDTMELFQMSISTKIDLIRDLAEDAPRCLVDPRLIKLALFNLLTNALEAIRKTDPEHNAYGRIIARTQRSGAGGLQIMIEDSGTGILNKKGTRASRHEIDKIFELGYTTEKLGGAQGEGLGLNWVRTIVQDLHQGQIHAENVDGSGACFVMTFKPLEQQNEAIGEAVKA